MKKILGFLLLLSPIAHAADFSVNLPVESVPSMERICRDALLVIEKEHGKVKSLSATLIKNPKFEDSWRSFSEKDEAVLARSPEGKVEFRFSTQNKGTLKCEGLPSLPSLSAGHLKRFQRNVASTLDYVNRQFYHTVGCSGAAWILRYEKQNKHEVNIFDRTEWNELASQVMGKYQKEKGRLSKEEASAMAKSELQLGFLGKLALPFLLNYYFKMQAPNHPDYMDQEGIRKMQQHFYSLFEQHRALMLLNYAHYDLFCD